MHSIGVTRFDHSDPRLGRHVEHDDRSLAFAMLPKLARPKGIDRFWGSQVKPLNQGDVGSCTGNATAQWLNTDYAQGMNNLISRKFDEDDALRIYSLATTLDTVPGSYPPSDTGSTGTAACKAARHLGFIGGYSWLFSFTSLQAAAEKTPVMCGTVWTEDMFKPVNGLVKVGPLSNSNIAGGHEYLMCGIDWTAEAFVFRNSWGDQDAWPGCKPGGYFAIGFKDYRNLQEFQGDFKVPNFD